MSCAAYISLLVLVCVCGQNPIDSHLHGYPLAYASARRKRIKEGISHAEACFDSARCCGPCPLVDV